MLLNNQYRDITGLMKATDTKSKVRGGNSDACMESKNKVSISRSGTGAQKGGRELTSQPCPQLLPCYTCVFIVNKINSIYKSYDWCSRNDKFLKQNKSFNWQLPWVTLGSSVVNLIRRSECKVILILTNNIRQHFPGFEHLL